MLRRAVDAALSGKPMEKDVAKDDPKAPADAAPKSDSDAKPKPDTKGTVKPDVKSKPAKGGR